MKRPHVSPQTRRILATLFGHLDYGRLGPVYCYEGGDAFWAAKRRLCLHRGLAVAEALLARVPPGGRSLYVGAGVAELPCLMAEALDGRRRVEPYNLRRTEVAVLNRACRQLPIRFHPRDAATAEGSFDHLWIVSVLNDPERFPHLSPLSYGNASPVTFDPVKFQRERRIVRGLIDRSLAKLALPGLVTTSIEEVAWIADWCHRRRIPYRVERRQYPTALVGDPICFVTIGGGGLRGSRGR